MVDFILKQKVQDDMKNAMRSREALRLETIRMLLAAIKQREIDDRVTSGNAPLTDGQIVGIINKMIKQRQDSVTHYQAGNRQDLVDKERAEIAILAEYLPKALTDEEVAALVKESIAAVNATSVKDMAKVMALVKEKAEGRIDMGKAGALVKQFIS